MKSVLICVLLSGVAFGVVSSDRPVFVNIAEKAGLKDVFPNGGVTSKEFILETTGSGLAWIDYDNDGLPDLFVLSGAGGSNRMYHNEGHDRFREVTAQMGLASSGWAQGVCAGDYDNDGYTDLFVTYWGQNHLYRNLGGARFEDVTEKAGLKQDRTRYNTGCAFLDVSGTGRLDLFVANYLKFDPSSTPKPGANPYCFYRSIPVACGPRGLPFDRNILYRNNGNGTFSDVSDVSGVAEPEGHYGLGVLTGDFNEDGKPDIYVACDQTPSLLYINKGNGKFEEEALLRGVAFDQNGKAMSGMGVTAGDYLPDGHLSIFRTNFSDEFETLYRNRGTGVFDDVTLDAGLGVNTRYVGWGTGFFDFNNDGKPDILLVNGHVFPEVDKLKTDISYKDHAILYQNMGGGRFLDITANAGAALTEKHSSRGAAFADIDNEGLVEVAINNQNEAPSLLKLQNPGPGNWVELHLVGVRSNRSAIGARVTVTANGVSQTQEVRSGGSYLSQSDFRLHFGLGGAREVNRIDVQWPVSGRQSIEHSAVDQILTIKEP